jgi:hypothetical protein
MEFFFLRKLEGFSHFNTFYLECSNSSKAFVQYVRDKGNGDFLLDENSSLCSVLSAFLSFIKSKNPTVSSDDFEQMSSSIEKDIQLKLNLLTTIPTFYCYDSVKNESNKYKHTHDIQDFTNVPFIGEIISIQDTKKKNNDDEIREKSLITSFLNIQKTFRNLTSGFQRDTLFLISGIQV